MRPIHDLKGCTFGELLALDRFVKSGKSKWHCLCSCGANVDVFATHLIRGNSTSCGLCFGSPVKAMPEHASWIAMMTRCTNSNHIAYHRYGGRGIKVCERWRMFENFYADMGPRPYGMSLDRVDVNGDYKPENCRWSTRSKQSNNRANNRTVSFMGQLLTVSQVATSTGEVYHKVYSRLVRKGLRNAAKVS